MHVIQFITVLSISLSIELKVEITMISFPFYMPKYLMSFQQ